MNKVLAVAIPTLCNQDQYFNATKKACSSGYFLCLLYFQKVGYDTPNYTYIYQTIC